MSVTVKLASDEAALKQFCEQRMFSVMPRIGECIEVAEEPGILWVVGVVHRGLNAPEVEIGSVRPGAEDDYAGEAAGEHELGL